MNKDPINSFVTDYSYISPLSTRYSSPEMSHLFSAHFRASAFRKLWIALAKAQKTLGLPITELQIAQMEAHISDIDFARIKAYEIAMRHDVMAHIHAFGDLCPDALPIIHLGATSTYVTDNADLIQLRAALSLLFQKLLHILSQLTQLAKTHRADPCLSYTHFQPAQPTTIGKRICLWLQDFLLDAQEWLRLIQEMPFLGAKGATGTQSSFLFLFENDHAKVLQMEKEIANAFHFTRIWPIAGQTYTRKLDLHILNALASFAASAHKFATDVRLLAHEEEMLEPFGASQVGSSAMPHKRNPIYSERICGLARFAISLAQNPAYTTATQWLERTLDDSSNRRIVIPEAFLTIDAILNLMAHLLAHPQIQADIALSHVERYLPQLCMEPLLMQAVKRGANRQQIHEKLRLIAHHAMKAAEPMQALKDAIQEDRELRLLPSDLEALAHPSQLVGRAAEQVDDFLAQDVAPFLQEHRGETPSIPQIEI